MLNKKKVAIAVLLLVFVIVVIIFAINGVINKGSKVYKLYNKLQKSNAYMFEMKDENNYEIVIAKKDGQTAIDMNNNGDKITTLVKDGIEYLISHSQKEYYAYNGSLSEETVVTDMLKDLEKADSTGKEKINGKTYKYEEYKGFEGFLTSTNIDIEASNVTTRFYFKGKNLVYIKTMVENAEDELLEIKISYSAPDELFEIPSDYAETTY